MPLIMLLTPKIMGLKNIMRINNAVVSLFSEENPGAINETKNGANIINTRQTAIRKTRKIVKSVIEQAKQEEKPVEVAA